MGFDSDAGAPMKAFESIPEVLLPVQVEQGHRFGVAVGERRMLCAMLLDAATCFCRYRCARDNNGRKLFRDAERWIRSQEDRSPFSFHAVCGLLGLNAHQLRVNLLESAYRKSSPLQRFGDENRSAERRSRGAGSRSASTGVSRARSYRPRLGERGNSLPTSLVGRG
jgi:hypothetical protein